MLPLASTTVIVEPEAMVVVMLLIDSVPAPVLSGGACESAGLAVEVNDHLLAGGTDLDLVGFRCAGGRQLA